MLRASARGGCYRITTAQIGQIWVRRSIAATHRLSGDLLLAGKIASGKLNDVHVEVALDERGAGDAQQRGEIADLAAQLQMEQIFYLDLGEPFLSPRVTQELPLLRAKNPNARIVISTNGVLLNTDAKREAALNVSQILFSVHGISNEMCRKYMHRADFDKAFEAMRAMVKYRDARGAKKPILEWKYLYFNWNDHPKTLARAIEMAKEIGVDIISFWPTNNPFYGASWRYRLGLLNQFGAACWKGREIILRPENVPAGERH